MVLSQRKGKLKKNKLRLYAIKVHDNCFVITSGAIKMSQSTQGNTENNTAIEKLTFARDYLKREGVIDDDSFYELLNELE